jgi:hypothetical protein
MPHKMSIIYIAAIWVIDLFLSPAKSESIVHDKFIKFDLGIHAVEMIELIKEKDYTIVRPASQTWAFDIDPQPKEPGVRKAAIVILTAPSAGFVTMKFFLPSALEKLVQTNSHPSASELAAAAYDLNRLIHLELIGTVEGKAPDVIAAFKEEFGRPCHDSSSLFGTEGEFIWYGKKEDNPGLFSR